MALKVIDNERLPPTGERQGQGGALMPRGRPRQTAAAWTPRRGPRRANNRPQVPFAYKLVLNQWLLSLFNVKRFEELAEHLRNEALEGLDENNVHHFHHALTAQLFNLTQLPTELLLEYDQNIVTAHAAAERAAHHARRGADRLEVLPVPGAALHRDLPRPLLPRSRRPCSRR